MEDLNITMEKYIKIEEEKARRQGRTFNWQTTTYGKIEYYENEDDSFTKLKTKYTAIVFDDTSDSTLMGTYAKNRFENENDKINTPSSLSPEPTIGYIDDLDFFKDFKNEFPSISYNDLMSKSDPLIEPSVKGYDEGIVHSYEQRLEMIWGKAVNRVHVLYFAGLTDGMKQTLGDRLSMVYTGMSDTEMRLDVADTLCFQLGGARRKMTWRQFILALGLHTEEEIVESGFGAYWSNSERVIPDNGDLNDYWMKISSDMDFLGSAPSYVFIRDPVRRLCHKMIACSISGRRSHLRRHAEGRKSGSRLSGGHFIGRLAAHFRLVSDQGLKGLLVVASELLLIDFHELGRLNICRGTLATTIRSLAPDYAIEDREAREGGARVTAECCRLVFDSTLVSSSRLSYQRRITPSTCDASTFIAPYTDDQPDP
nr:hypothetical protein [Tanacetum cinerariifolium]